MKHIFLWLTFIVLLVMLFLWSVIPPEKKIRLGKDLQGGVSLVYAVDVPEDTDADEVLAQTIDVLKQRVNPQGILDIGMQPVGRDRIEVVMPLPNAEVRGLQTVYQDAREVVLDMARIRADELDLALASGAAIEKYAGADSTDRAARIAALQAAWNEGNAARSDLERLEAADPADPAAVNAALDRVATAEIAYEDLRNGILAETLREQRLLEILALDNAPTERDEAGVPIPSSSERAKALEDLRRTLPHLATSLEALETAYTAYEAKRTGLDDPEDLKRLLRGAGVLEFRIAVNPASQDVPISILREQLAERGPKNTDSVIAQWFPINDLKQWADDEESLASLTMNPAGYFQGRYEMVADQKDGQYYVLLYVTPDKSLDRGSEVDWSIRRAGRTIDELGRPAVSFGLDKSGGREMRRLTTPHVGEPMAIVLDGEVYTAPNLNSAIGDRGVIQGNFGDEEINYLIRVLAAGSLEARMSSEPISASILGPSIGQDNLVRGLEAVAISVAVVAVIMILYYFGAGLIADIALLINAIMIFGVMALIDGTFTLPGLAGIALTVGMAVDANVLIFERVREELINNQEDLRTSLRLGFSKAASAIVDGNITNLIVCFILYNTAATEVKGFALTLSIGVIATLFTSLFVSRVVFALCTDVFKIRSLPMLPTVVPSIHRLLEPKIDWVSARIPLLGLSLVLAVGSLTLFFSRGADVLETEFRGGVSVVMTTRAARDGESTGTEREALGRLLVPRGEVETAVKDIGRERADDPALAELAGATVLTVGPTLEDGSAASFQIKVANPPGIDADANIADVVVNALVDRFGDILAITRPVSFDTEGVDDHSTSTFRLERGTLGESIGRPNATVPVGEFRGGVAVLVEGVTPPVTIADIDQRLSRMRNQPDFADSRGRRTEVVGLDSAGEIDGTPTYSSFVVMSADDEVSSLLVDVETWDRALATQEFSLVKAALLREASLDQVSSFSPKVAENLANTAIVAVILSLLGMLVYIWFRFGSLRYSLCAIVALVFNVSVCLGAIALSVTLGEKTFSGVRVLDEFRIDLNVVAGLLTIVGYSLNDTIVILDRIRENRGKLSYASREVVNRSINQTFSRTIMTSGTTITSAIILYSLGGTGIRPFAFTFLVGLIAATFSSVAIAAPLTWSRGGGSSSSSPKAADEDPALEPAGA